MLNWHIIFVIGDRTKLSIAQLYKEELRDWSIASRISFDSEEEAYTYMVKLANENGLNYKAKGCFDNFLD